VRVVQFYERDEKSESNHPAHRVDPPDELSECEWCEEMVLSHELERETEWKCNKCKEIDYCECSKERTKCDWCKYPKWVQRLRLFFKNIPFRSMKLYNRIMAIIKYKQNYLDHYGWSRFDILMSELNPRKVAVDLHHIYPKGMGGRETFWHDGVEYDINCVENLIAVTREEHDICDDPSHPDHKSKDELWAIHQIHMKNNVDNG